MPIIMMMMSVHRRGIITVLSAPVFFMLCYLCHCAYSYTDTGTTIVNIGLIFDEYKAPLKLFRKAVVHHNTKRNSSYQFFCYERGAVIEDSFNATRTLCHNYGSKTIMVGGPVKLTSVDAIRSHSNYYHVPYITASISKRDVGLSVRSQGSDYLISIRPGLVPAIVDLIQYFKWKTFGYIYDDNIGLARLNTLLQELSLKNYNIAFRKLGKDDNVRDTLQEFRDSRRHRIICDTSLKGTRQILKEAIRLGAITSSYHYLLLNLDIEEIDFYEYQFGGMNITGFQIINRTHPIFEKQYRRWNNETMKYPPPSKDDVMGAEAALSYDIAKVMEQGTWMVVDGRYGIGAGQYLQHRNGRDCSDYDFTPWRLDEQILASLKAVTLPKLPDFEEGMTGRVEFDDFGERVNYSMRLLSLLADGLKPIGTWTHNEEQSLNFYDDHKGSKSSLDLRNRTIIVTSVDDAPYVILKENHELLEGNDKYEGYCIDLLNQINTIVPFNYNITLSRDGSYGSYNAETGQWGGMVGELINGTADIAVASLTISAEREKVIDFTKPFMSLGISIMVKKPQNIKPEVFSFMHPLSSDIWLCIVFAYIGVSVVLFLVSRFSPDEWYTVETMQPVDPAHSPSTSPFSSPDEVEDRDKSRVKEKKPEPSLQVDDRPNPKDVESKMELPAVSSGNTSGGADSNNSVSDERTNDFDFPNSLWFSMGALMQQGCDICPRALSGRIVGGVWWFFTLIVISSYTANLAAFLTVTRMESPINSAEDLVEQKDISYGCINSGSTKDFFENSDIPTFKKMWDTMHNAEPSPLTETNAQGVEMVRHNDGKYVFLMESTTNEYISQQQPCDTMKVGSNLDSKGYGIGVSRNLTEFGDNLTLAILELREKGILAGLKKKWWYDKGQCDDTPSGKDRASLSLSNVAGVFYILVSGLAVAMVIAVLEFYWKSRALSRKQKVSLTSAMKDKVRLSVTGDSTPLPPELAPILKKQSNGSEQTPGASEEKIVLAFTTNPVYVPRRDSPAPIPYAGERMLPLIETTQAEKRLTPPGDTEV